MCGMSWCNEGFIFAMAVAKYLVVVEVDEWSEYNRRWGFSIMFPSIHVHSFSEAFYLFICTIIWLFVKWGDVMVVFWLPRLLQSNWWLQKLVSGQNVLGGDVFSWDFQTSIFVHVQRPCIPSISPKLGYKWNEVMSWWYFGCHGRSKVLGGFVEIGEWSEYMRRWCFSMIFSEIHVHSFADALHPFCFT